MQVRAEFNYFCKRDLNIFLMNLNSYRLWLFLTDALKIFTSN